MEVIVHFPIFSLGYKISRFSSSLELFYIYLGRKKYFLLSIYRESKSRLLLNLVIL